MMSFLVCRLQFECARVFAIRISPVPFVIEQLVSERDVCFGQIRIETERPLSSLLRQRERLIRSQIRVRLFSVCVRPPAISESETRVQFDGALKVLQCQR